MNAPFLYKLKCYRCLRKLPEDQFIPADRTNSERGTVKKLEPCYAKHLHKLCNMCREQMDSEWIDHPLYSSAVHRYWNQRFFVVKAQASRRGILFLLSKEDMLAQYLKQDGKCALTGLHMLCEITRKDAKMNTSTSIDRIDSNGPYHRDNIQIVCRAVNTMKNDMTHSELLRWCGAILAYQAKKEEEIFSFIG